MRVKYIYILTRFLLGTVFFVLPGQHSLGQVGIYTTAPEGLLDLGNSSVAGIVYPVVALADTTVETIINPNGGSLAAGTCVYNNNTAGIGENSVYPGIYIWNGTKWIPQFNKKDSKIFTQTSNVRTGSNDLTNPSSGNQEVSFDVMTYTPKFSGPHKVVMTLHYGAGKTNVPSGTQYINYAAGSGMFNMTFNSSTTSYSMKSYSGYNNDRLFKGGSSAPAIEYNNTYNQSKYVREETLTRSTNYPFTLTFNQDYLEGHEGDGDLSISTSEDGRGYIIQVGNIACTVEIYYVGE